MLYFPIQTLVIVFDEGIYPDKLVFERRGESPTVFYDRISSALRSIDPRPATAPVIALK
jgi:hypothetical protein